MCAMTSAQNRPVLTYADNCGEHLFALDRDAVTIGRMADQDLVLTENYVSRRHASIRRVDDRFEVVDQGSTHGTYVNGLRAERAILHPGDVVQFGSLNGIRFCFDDPPVDKDRQTHSLAEGLLSALTIFAPSMGNASPAVHEMEQLNFVINAARELNSGGAIKDILRVLLRSSIKLTGVERGFVFLRDDGEMRLALGLRSDGTVIEDDTTVSRRSIQKALESNSKFSISDTLNDEDASAWTSVLANAIRSIYCIPLRKHMSGGEPDRVLGLLYLDSQLGAGNLSEIDQQVLDMVATEAATLLDNALLAEAEVQARRAAEELAVAAQIHSGLMSITLPKLPHAVLQAKTVPCSAIGGDFFDAVAVGDCVCAAIADVSGKGVPASIVAATLQGIIHAQLLTGQELSAVADLVNRFLYARNVGKYATMVLLKLFPDGTLEYINCGHVEPTVVNASGIRHLEESNFIVGLIPDASYTAARCQLEPGDRVLLATDGIIEARNPAGEMFGDSRFDEIAVEGTLDTILERLAQFQQGREAQDDWTLFEILYRDTGALE